MKWILVVFFAFCALSDLKNRNIPAIWLYAGLGGLSIYALYGLIMGSRAWTELLFSLLPGTLCYLLCLLTRQMGEGDALLILGMGFCMDLKKVIRVVMAAFFLSCAVSILLLILKRGMKNRRIAFVPFLFCAVLLYG